MPQIAQQDYIVIKPKAGRAAQDDAECLRRLKQACENGTIFDCLVGDITAIEGTLGRVLGAHNDGSYIDIYNQSNSEPYALELPYTVEQYSGLAVVQEAVDGLGMMEDLPVMEAREGYLYESNNLVAICVNGFKLSATASGGTLTALEISDTKPDDGEDFINIAWEDALKLIGLPIS